jgi:hypothetical protein
MAETLAKSCGQRSAKLVLLGVIRAWNGTRIRFVEHTGTLLGPEAINVSDRVGWFRTWTRVCRNTSRLLPVGLWLIQDVGFGVG